VALFAAAARPPAEGTDTPFVQAVEFPYHLCPPSLWERELVRLKNIGIETVAFSVPSKWHQVAPGDFDFTGRTNPRRDLAGFIRLLRRVGLQAWVETKEGSPPALIAILAPQTVNHGGPVAWLEPALRDVDAGASPSGVHRIAAGDPAALEQSRDALASARGALIWTGVFDALYPAGWASAGAPMLREGVLGLNGEERASAALRRNAMLLRAWGPLLPAMQRAPSAQ
jgi:hypothetical protein